MLPGRTECAQNNILYYTKMMGEAMSEDSDAMCGVCDHSRSPSAIFKEFFNVEDFHQIGFYSIG